MCVCVCVCVYFFVSLFFSLIAIEVQFYPSGVLIFLYFVIVLPFFFFSPTPHYTVGITENIKFQRILTRVRDPRSLYLSTKTWLYLTAYRLYYWKPQAKQLVRQEHSPTHQKKINNRK